MNAFDYGNFEKSNFILLHSVRWTTENGKVKQVNNTHYAL